MRVTLAFLMVVATTEGRRAEEEEEEEEDESKKKQQQNYLGVGEGVTEHHISRGTTLLLAQYS